MLTVLVDVLLPILVVVCTGFVLRRRMAIDLTSLNRLAIYGLSPSLIFVSLVRADLGGEEAVRMVTLSVGLVLCMALITLACGLGLRVGGADLSALLLAALFMNSGNFGLPLARFAFGEEGFQRAVLFFVPQSIMAQTLGVAVAAAGGLHGVGLRAQLKGVLLRVSRMPTVYAVLAALAVRASGITLDGAPGAVGALFRGVALLSEATLPLLLLVLGMQIAQGGSFDQPRLTGLAVALRLLVSPLVALGLALALGMASDELRVGIVQASMPTAVNMTVMAIEFNARPPLVVSAVLASSVGSLVTLSLILSLLR